MTLVNLLADGGFESGTTGWTDGGAASTIEWRATGAEVGTKCARLTASGVGQARWLSPNVTAAPGDDFVLGFDHKLISGTGTWEWRIQFRDATPATISEVTYSITPGASWVPEQEESTTAPSGTVGVRIGIYRLTGGAIGDSIDIDEALIAEPEAPPPPPAGAQNVVWIVLDDASPNVMMHMAQMRDMIDHGYNFTRNYITVPVCSPSRAGFLTGKYSHNNGVLQNGGEDGSYRAFMRNDNEDQTVATLAADEGVLVGLFGKYINGYSPNGLDNPDHGFPALHVPPGYAEFFAPGAGYQEFDYQATRKITGEAVELFVAEDGLEGNYLTDVINAHAIDFIDRHAAEPFVLILTPFATHTNIAGDPEGGQGYEYPPAPRDRPDSPDRPAGWDDPEFPSTGDLGDWDGSWPDYGPLAGQEANWNTSPTPAPPWFPPAPLSVSTLSEYRKDHLQRVQMAQSVDDLIADVRAKLVAESIDDVTWIVVTTDNGYHLGEHAIPVGKGAPYDEDVRLPMVVYPPGGLVDGVEIPNPVSNVDMLPTVLDLLDIATLPADIDGRSLVPLIDGDPVDWRLVGLTEYETANWDWDDAVGTGEPPPWVAIRGTTLAGGEWAFITYAKDDLSVPPELNKGELYFLIDDPGMIDNLWYRCSPESALAIAAYVDAYTSTAGEDVWLVGLEPFPTISLTDGEPPPAPETEIPLELYVAEIPIHEFAIVTGGSRIGRVPPKRGKNEVIPTRGGTVWTQDKPFDQNTLVWDLWVDGVANLDRVITAFAPGQSLREVLTVYGSERRRCLAETVNMLDLTPAGADTYHLVIEQILPYSFWEDEFPITQTLDLTDVNEVLQFTDFEGGQGPIEDALITIAGRIANPHIEDQVSTLWLEFEGTTGADGGLRIDCGKFEVVEYTAADPSGIDKTDQVNQKRTGPLLKLIPKLSNGEIRIRFISDEIHGAIQVTLEARRKFFRGAWGA
jgi:arylsulfatase A-like enzyme